jgi:tRNA(Arg) A34 adenosine deaminase TadA
MADVAGAWEQLETPWRLALDEAWLSWCAGSAGVGAVVVDGGGAVVARGRNRMMERTRDEAVLAGTPLAHAEMNALAGLPFGGGFGGHTIYTTFEPCLMCASTILQTGIGHVRYAAADPVFDGLHDWLTEFKFAADRLPNRTCLGGPVGAFAHVLHLSWLAFWLSEGHVIDAHRRLSPRHLDLATRVATDGHLAEVATAGGTVVDAMGALWPDLVELS